MADQKLSEPIESGPKPDAGFWRVADAFIANANQHATSEEPGTVSAAFMYSAARFNSFVIASQCGTKEALENEKSAAIDYFVNQFKLALTENVDDYLANFDKYLNFKG